MTACRKPCLSCPWVVGNTAAGIPRFDLEKAEALAGTCPDERDYGPNFGAHLFACHQSREGAEIICAGWLAAVGRRHPMVRYMVATGRVLLEALEPGAGWPPLHKTFHEVIEKLRATT